MKATCPFCQKRADLNVNGVCNECDETLQAQQDESRKLSEKARERRETR